MKHAFGIAGAAALALGISALAAQAASVRITSISGKWISALPANTVGLTGLNTEEIRWGTPFSPNTIKSGYRFDAVSTPAPPVGGFNEDTPFDLGEFTHFNFPISSSPTPSSIQGATLELEFAGTLFSENDGAGTETAFSAFKSIYEFSHWETPNNDDPCADGGDNGDGVNSAGCADRVVALQNAGASDKFEVDDLTYFLSVSGFEVGGVPLTQFWTTEGETNKAQLQGLLTTQPNVIPLPAAAWLLLGGLGGLGLVARRRKPAA